MNKKFFSYIVFVSLLIFNCKKDDSSNITDFEVQLIDSEIYCRYVSYKETGEKKYIIYSDERTVSLKEAVKKENDDNYKINYIDNVDSDLRLNNRLGEHYSFVIENDSTSGVVLFYIDVENEEKSLLKNIVRWRDSSLYTIDTFPIKSNSFTASQYKNGYIIVAFEEQELTAFSLINSSMNQIEFIDNKIIDIKDLKSFTFGYTLYLIYINNNGELCKADYQIRDDGKSLMFLSNKIIDNNVSNFKFKNTKDNIMLAYKKNNYELMLFDGEKIMKIGYFLSLLDFDIILHQNKKPIIYYIVGENESENNIFLSNLYVSYPISESYKNQWIEKKIYSSESPIFSVIVENNNKNHIVFTCGNDLKKINIPYTNFIDE